MIKNLWVIFVKAWVISSIPNLVLTAENVDISYHRWSHTATLIDKTLYLYGGKTEMGKVLNDNTTDSNDLWTLDITQKFDVFSPPWKKVETSNIAPKVSRHSATYGGKNNEILVIFGGETGTIPIPQNSLFYFNTISSQWSNPNINITDGSVSPSTRRLGHTSTTSINNSIIYFIGGQHYIDYQYTRIYQEIAELDTIQNNWSFSYDSKSSLAFNMLYGRMGHSATLLKDGKIYIIGGFNEPKLELVGMQNVDVFDTKNFLWSSMTIDGNIPPSRRFHGAVANSNSTAVIIFGGADVSAVNCYNDLYILNTLTSPMTWSFQSMKGQIPGKRCDLTMTLVGTNIIVLHVKPSIFYSERIYVFGGKVGSGNITNTNELWILNVSIPFNTLSAPWLQGISDNAPTVCGHTASLSGENNDQMIIFGGEASTIPLPSSTLYNFNTKTLQWSNIKSNSSLSTRRVGHAAINNFNKLTIYFLGGQIYSDSQYTNIYPDALAFDTARNSLSNVTSTISSSRRMLHTATSLVDGKIYIIGGQSESKKELVSMNDIDVYDTVSGLWSTQIAQGDSPLPRRGHAAVVLPGRNTDLYVGVKLQAYIYPFHLIETNKILIFGGTDQNGTVYYNDLTTLDTSTKPLTWSKQVTKGSGPSARAGHSMTMVGTNIIVLNENSTSKNSTSPTSNFTLSSPTTIESITTSPQPSSTPPPRYPMAVLAALLTFISIILLSVIATAIFFLRWRQKQAKEQRKSPYKAVAPKQQLNLAAFDNVQA
ncbi:hypothetical protein G9A89_013359 [Geosiphon pyriformis]|nr:hypothetical protein G9A89_013359 [Geosiphon pyriformis]